MRSTLRLAAGRRKPIPNSSITTSSPKARTSQRGNNRNFSRKNCALHSNHFVSKKELHMSDKRVFLTKHSPEFWRVTLNHPPLNIFGPKTIPQLNEIITAIETDKELKVVVFNSAIDGFFMTHYDFLAKIEETTSLPPGPTGLQPLPDMLVRLSRAPVVSIALIRGRATGVGSELALACDMRFASREKATLSHFEVGAGVIPGGGPMARLTLLMGPGTALEGLLAPNTL